MIIIFLIPRWVALSFRSPIFAPTKIEWVDDEWTEHSLTKDFIRLNSEWVSQSRNRAIQKFTSITRINHFLRRFPFRQSPEYSLWNSSNTTPYTMWSRDRNPKVLIYFKKSSSWSFIQSFDSAIFGNPFVSTVTLCSSHFYAIFLILSPTMFCISKKHFSNFSSTEFFFKNLQLSFLLLKWLVTTDRSTVYCRDSSSPFRLDILCRENFYLEFVILLHDKKTKLRSLFLL